jgi:hypothetical protein
MIGTIPSAGSMKGRELKTPCDEYGRYLGREPVIGVDEPPALDDGEASSSDDDSSALQHMKIKIRTWKTLLKKILMRMTTN